MTVYEAIAELRRFELAGYGDAPVRTYSETTSSPDNMKDIYLTLIVEDAPGDKKAFVEVC